jgi:hypothetical protein
MTELTSVLTVYRAPSGQWSGKVHRTSAGMVNPLEIGGIAGCASPEEVRESLEDVGIYADSVVLLPEGTGLYRP